MAGLPSDRGTLDLLIGRAALGLSNAFAECKRINNMLQSDPRFTDAILAAAPPDGYGYTTDELDAIKPAFVAFALLYDIATEQANPNTFDDYFFFGRLLMGVQGQP